jgi:hypothetical protein
VVIRDCNRAVCIEVVSSHDSAVSQPVFDALASNDSSPERADILDAVRGYLQSGSVSGVDVTRSDILDIVRYYLIQQSHPVSDPVCGTIP